MNKKHLIKRMLSILMAVVVAAGIMTPSACAANRTYISEITLEAGADAVERLEADDWSVMSVGLNMSTEPEEQLYMGYKKSTDNAITNVIVTQDVGDTFTDENGISYTCASHVDVDEGIGGGTGCVYYTRDERAGAPLVGLDVLRGAVGDAEVLYPITNDGAEIVRTEKGTPADLESAGDDAVVYLAQIRDGIVCPYIRDVGIVVDKDKWNAVYTACERGYNYYVDGDLDDSSEMYTLLVYERTADPAEAVTNIAAVAAHTVKALENAAGRNDNASSAQIGISGTQYVRISSQPISGEIPFFLYRTKDPIAGNPISMLYAERIEESQTFLFGSWANSYFFSQGITTAYTYCMNEDLYNTLWSDLTVCVKQPVQLLDSVMSAIPGWRCT